MFHTKHHPQHITNMATLRASLKPLDMSLPSAMADLPAEMLTRIVRAAVAKNKLIQITDIDEEVEALIKPFVAFPLLHEIAQNEVMRANLIVVSFASLTGSMIR